MADNTDTIIADAGKVAIEIAELVSPLAGTAAAALLELVRLVVSHPDGAELTAKRTAQALLAHEAVRQ